MSTDSMSILKLDSELTVQEEGLPASPFSSKSADSPWDIDRFLRMAQAGVAAKDTSTQKEPWVRVAPDYYVRKSEYQRRFGEIDLDYYRQRMSPALFLAYVRHMGVVPGFPGLDVTELTTPPDY